MFLSQVSSTLPTLLTRIMWRRWIAETCCRTTSSRSGQPSWNGPSWRSGWRRTAALLQAESSILGSFSNTYKWTCSARVGT
ncbi:hypothetical protein E2C01_078514 [Portunus trituberculatus]|uniref:Uncharacterized protein n=1 Tax=Portunus trituberculatus TaxID=210409 RepID=A0A5B7IQE8_PORTR|nr:hypothetical protein [Portunus trituberculatus]